LRGVDLKLLAVSSILFGSVANMLGTAPVYD
jgi:hypothetical protein